MSSIFFQKSYYKELRLVIDEALDKVATVYEESKVCSNDQLVVGKITVDTSKIYGLSGMISDAIEISDIKNYENTNERLNSLAVKVNDLITKLEELGELINTKSMETYMSLLTCSERMILPFTGMVTSIFCLSFSTLKVT